MIRIQGSQGSRIRVPPSISGEDYRGVFCRGERRSPVRGAGRGHVVPFRRTDHVYLSPSGGGAGGGHVVPARLTGRDVSTSAWTSGTRPFGVRGSYDPAIYKTSIFSGFKKSITFSPIPGGTPFILSGCIITVKGTPISMSILMEPFS